jgi:putative transposase
MELNYFPRFNISSKDRLVINNIAYKRRARLGNGYLLERADDPDIVETFTDADLSRAVMTPNFRFERGAFSEGRARSAGLSPDGLISSLPTAEQEELLWKREFTLQIEAEILAGRGSLSDASLKKLSPEIGRRLDEAERQRVAKRNDQGDIIRQNAGDRSLGGRKPPSPRTIRRWRKYFIEGDRQAIALRIRRFNSGNRSAERLALPERQILHRYAPLYMSETRPTRRDIHRRMKAHIVDEENPRRLAAGEPTLRVPSYERLLAEIKSLPEFDVYACRYGLDAAKRHFAMVRTGVDVERALQRVEFDEWRVNLLTLCANAGILDKLSDKLKSEIATVRPWLCAALDCATRICLGMKIGLTPTAELALDTLEMVVTPKAPYALAVGARTQDDFYGSPERIVHDQGASFLSLRFRRAIVDLDCDAEAPPAGIPMLRGRIERFFRTAGTQALCPYTGRTFESVAAKGDYDPKDRVSLTLQELCGVLTRWVLDVYHNSPHAGLKGETPANCWKRLVRAYDIVPPPDAHRRRVVFGLELTRELTPKGVRVLGLHYNCREIQELRRRHGDIALEIRISQWDLGHLAVRLADGGWLTVTNVRSGFDNVPLPVWLAAEADLRRRFKREAALADEIVAAAIKDAWETGAASAARVGILSTRWSAEQLAYAEKEIGFGFGRAEDLPASMTPLNENLLEGSIPTGGGDTTPAAPRRGKGRSSSFKITD